jgi:hypothetical protein
MTDSLSAVTVAGIKPIGEPATDITTEGAARDAHHLGASWAL